MIRIRSEQVHTLDEQTDDVVIEVQRFVEDTLPDIARTLGKMAVREQAEAAVMRAWTYGIQAPEEAFVFASLTFVLGPYFDANESYPWAAEILCDSEGLKADRLMAHVDDQTRGQSPA